MRIGQTSIIVFVSKIAVSFLGFAATVYFARFLGAEVIGIYTLMITIVNWLVISAQLGIGEAMTKRISEGTGQGEFFSAAVIWIVVMGIIISTVTIFAQSTVENYVGKFNEYTIFSPVWFIIGMLGVSFFSGTVLRILTAQRMVHIRGLLKPVKTGLSGLIQVLLVLTGFGLLGMLTGWMIGSFFVGVIALYWVRIRPARPKKRHFRSLLDYSKFSWLGQLKSRAFTDVDILLLGVFVPSSIVGIYSVAWSLSKFLEVFGSAIRSTLFPELSYTSTQESKQAAAGLVEDSLAYTGLIAVPGLVGGVILDDRLLRLYGEEFADGTAVLGFLILAILLFSYQQQLMGAINGLDRPDLAFRVNTVFIVLNVGMNILFIPQFGIEGAAVASVFSTGISLALAYHMLSRLIIFNIPYPQLTRQCAAALVMGTVVLTARWAVETANFVGNNAIIVISLAGLGAGVYFFLLLVISPDFRITVGRNLPFEIPFLS